MKMLVTGATGYLGSRLIEYLLSRYEVLAPTHKEMDICDMDSVEKYFEKKYPEVVIHCAAISDSGRCEKEPEISYIINVMGAYHLSVAAKKIGAKCILCSSDQVYFGSKIKTSHKENEVLEPFTVYGRQKLLMERICLQDNADVVILRLSWLYDAERKSSNEHGDFLKMFQENLKSNKELSYPVYDHRGLTNVNEVVSNIEKAINLSGGIYNFGAPNDMNFYETMATVTKKLQENKWEIMKNEVAFCDNQRNICMNIEKIEHRGIYFKSTVDGLIDVIKLLQ